MSDDHHEHSGHGGNLALPLLATSPETDQPDYDETDGERSQVWTPNDSPRAVRTGPLGQPTHSPFASFRDPHNSKAAMRESRARRQSWICIDTLGRSTILQEDKRALVQRFGLRLPVRDMRILDPNLLTSETGKILVRDNCIVVSVEHVRLIIMAEQVIMTRDGHEERPLAAAFADSLQASVGTAARDLERRAAAESALAEDPDDDPAARLRREVAPLPFELVVLEVALGDVCNVLARLTKELDLHAHPALDALTRDVKS